MTKVFPLTQQIDMKFIENQDSEGKFKFNPCAVPFVPSQQKNKKNSTTDNDTVTSKTSVLAIDAEQMCWSPAFQKSDLQVYSDLILMQGDQFTTGYCSNKNDAVWKVHDVVGRQKHDCNGVDISKWNCFPEFVEELSQSPEIFCQTKFSSWLQEDPFYDGSRDGKGGSSICDESWSATPVSSASPPPNEIHNHSSVSYGSLPFGSLFSDLTPSNSGTNLSTDLTQGTPPSNESEASQSQAEDSETGSDLGMRYYSPFGTGVSTWLASGNTWQRDRLRSREEEGGKVADVEVDSIKSGNVWNDEESGVKEPRKTWMRQSTVDESDDSLFVMTGSVDGDSEELVELPCWEFPSTCDESLWLERTGAKKESLSSESWIGNCSESKNQVLPGNLHSHIFQQFEKNFHGGKSPSVERRRLEPTGRSTGDRLGHKSHPSFLPQKSYSPHQPFHGSNSLEGLQEQMLYMPHLRPSPFNPSTVPFFFVSGPPVYGDTRKYPMLNPYAFHMPLPTFVNCDYNSMLGQFYSYSEPTALAGVGGKNYPLAPVSRHTGPALELHQCLDQCYEQFRHLENERKKVEAELARQNPGKLVTSDNDLVVPLMPPNPSRIDRLIIEDMREHGRVVTLVSRMEQLRGVRFRPSLLSVFEYWLDATHKLQTCRKNEIINRKKYRLDSHGALQKEKDVLALADALSDLAVSIRRVRTATWCALQLVSTDLPRQCMKRAYTVARNSHFSPVGMHTPLEEEFEIDRESDCDDEYQDDEIDQFLNYNGYKEEMLDNSECSIRSETELMDCRGEMGEEIDYEEINYDFQERGKKPDFANYTEVESDSEDKACSEDVAENNEFKHQLVDDYDYDYHEDLSRETDYEDYSPKVVGDPDYNSSVEVFYDDA